LNVESNIRYPSASLFITATPRSTASYSVPSCHFTPVIVPAEFLMLNNPTKWGLPSPASHMKRN